MQKLFYMSSIGKTSSLKSTVSIGLPHGDGCKRVYRFSFNGKENDNETQTQDYGMRIYDVRIGKFLSVDPLHCKYPFYSPYHFAGNKPIVALDLDGLEDLWIHILKDIDGIIIKIWTSENISVNTHDRIEQLSGMKIPRTGLLVTEGYADKDKVEVFAYLPPNPEKYKSQSKSQPQSDKKTIDSRIKLGNVVISILDQKINSMKREIEIAKEELEIFTKSIDDASAGDPKNGPSFAVIIQVALTNKKIENYQAKIVSLEKQKENLKNEMNTLEKSKNNDAGN